MSESNQTHSNLVDSRTPYGSLKRPIFSSTFPTSRRLRLQADSLDGSSKLLDEKVLFLIFEAVNWNPFLLSLCSRVCKKINAIAKRVLWKQFCLSRAPGMVSDLLSGSRNGRIDGDWHALGKLLIYCAGCHSTENFEVRMVPGHVVLNSRFSRTSGKSFLMQQFRTDVLYVTDPCEHDGDGLDIGLFRGVFRSFGVSEVWRFLINKRVQLHEREICPFCYAKVWSMAKARAIPRSAIIRLAAYEEKVEYFVCLNGHLNGKCSLQHLSDSEDDAQDTYDEVKMM